MTSNPLLYASLLGTHSLSRAPRLDVVRDLLGLQAQFASNPPLSLMLRASDFSESDWDAGLVKLWTHRGTIHVLRRDELGLYLSAADMAGEFHDGWWGMTGSEQARWAPFIAEQIAAGNDARDGLKRACLDAGMDESLLQKAFYGWGGLIKEMAWRGMLVCSPGTQKRYALPGPVEWMDRDDARRILVRRYFETFGPATRKDCAAFFGYPMAQLRPVLDSVTEELLCTQIGKERYYHAQPLEDGDVPECVLLPGFDQLVMAYRDRSRFIAPKHLRQVVNAAGIVFPVVIVRGMVRAKWKLKGDCAEIVPFERLYKKDEAAIRRSLRQGALPLESPPRNLRFLGFS